MSAAVAAPAAPTAPVGRGRGWWLLTGTALALVAVCVVAAGAGQLAIPPGEVAGSVLHRLDGALEWLLGGIGLHVDLPLDSVTGPRHPQGDAALWQVRFPRIALAVAVGAALAVAGALMQGVFGNPLAEPAIIGVSPGAAVGASLAIVTGLDVLGTWTVPLAAFLAALVTTLLVYGLSRSGGRTEALTLILTGVAVTAIASAVVAFNTFIASPTAREQIVFWQLGSLGGARWQAVAVVTPFVVVGIVVALLLARRLDLLALGDRSARHLGVNVERLRVVAIVVIALLVGAGVAFAGVIAFVGLVVPHLVRLVAGPGHRLLLPASAIGGALLLTVADLVARTAIPFADLPLGMLTSVVGGPFFLWLMRRMRSTQGGWA
ncbi:iron complex transport system permease protein [Georgenia satyanarayanai]|uniref:Iron complex transport system permease protein n=1 Tax=Georgenia satyanarayanai TaxID=860221 RepID=A0A2Y9BWK4_9MICO|nr:iron ABC transporter permease [Georgenia satyanarayanai]PYG00983.1 iron complex transport system permease protein [Georgenia satyanarayanai]SSA39222.1 iron complex transport system permease protein [Georgenia satyanarayanai]